MAVFYGGIPGGNANNKRNLLFLAEASTELMHVNM